MNYSENTATYGRKVVKTRRQKSYETKILKLLLTALALGCGLGFLVGVFTLGGTPKAQEQAAVSDLGQYGTLDGKAFTDDATIQWDSGADQFVPLDVSMDKDLQEFIYCLSYGYNMDFPFVMGVIRQESVFNPTAQSNTGDVGLMQINEINHDWLSEKFGITDFTDPYQNARAGIYILRTLFEKYDDPAQVLMAYNMGETGAKRLWDKGVFETEYSKNIMNYAVQYTAEIERMVEND